MIKKTLMNLKFLGGFKERDIENQERNKFRIRNKLNMKKYTDEYNKGFDIITLGAIPEHVKNIQKYTHSKPFNTTWEKLQMTSHSNFFFLNFLKLLFFLKFF